jgi:hypothetical protein
MAEQAVEEAVSAVMADMEIPEQRTDPEPIEEPVEEPTVEEPETEEDLGEESPDEAAEEAAPLEVAPPESPVVEDLGVLRQQLERLSPLVPIRDDLEKYGQPLAEVLSNAHAAFFRAQVATPQVPEVPLPPPEDMSDEGLALASQYAGIVARLDSMQEYIGRGIVDNRLAALDPAVESVCQRYQTETGVPAPATFRKQLAEALKPVAMSGGDVAGVSETIYKAAAYDQLMAARKAETSGKVARAKQASIPAPKNGRSASGKAAPGTPRSEAEAKVRSRNVISDLFDKTFGRQ